MVRPAEFVRIRAALLAGSWYPSEPESCRAAVLAHAAAPPHSPTAEIDSAGALHRGLIAPHAGFTYSGAAAGRGFARLGQAVPEADLVVVFGSHRGPDGPNTVFRGDAWDTPLGPLACATGLAEQLVESLGLEEEPVSPARADNGIELVLPFVRHFFPQAELLALGVAAAESALTIGAAVGLLARPRRAVFVGSTDLTHYGPSYDFAPAGQGAKAVAWALRNDRAFLAKVLAADAAGVVRHGVHQRSACCPGAAAAALVAAQTFGHTPAPRLVDHYSSNDVRPSDSFVGYGSVLL
jgi:MEMO1 family protein